MPRRALPKSAGARRKRGTSGLNKEDRVKKHNALVDLYTAKKHLSDLRAISDSSSSDAGSDDAALTSDDEAENDLRKLQALLGCKTRGAGGASASAAAASSSARGKNGGAASSSSSDDDDDREPTLEDVLGVRRKSGKQQKQQQAGDDEDDEDGLGDAMMSGEDDEEEGEWELVEEGQEGAYADDEDMFASDEEGLDDDDEDDNVDRLAPPSDEEDDEQQNKKPKSQQRSLGAAAAALPPVPVPTSFPLPAEDLFVAKYIHNVCGKPDESALEASGELSLDVSVAPCADFAPPSQSKNKRSKNNNNSSKKNVMKEKTVEDLNPDCQVQVSAKAKKFLSMLANASKSDDTTTIHPVLSSLSPPVLRSTELQSTLLHLFSTYADASLAIRTWHNAREVCLAYATHCVNHLFKAATVTDFNDAQLEARRRKEEEAVAAATASSGSSGNSNKKKSKDTKALLGDAASTTAEGAGGGTGEDLRDRGFGNARVLVLLPMRNSAHRFVQDLCALTGTDWLSFQGQSSFSSDFSEMEEAEDPNFHRRPLDFQRQFDGNINDTFCFGVALDRAKAAKNLLAAAATAVQKSQDGGQDTQQQQPGEQQSVPQRRSEWSLQVYVPFLECQMIVASPLGLRKRLEKDGDLAVALSSIEVLVVDEAHVMLMQNWAHVDACLALLNRRPTTTTEGLNDMQRIYEWALEGQCRRHRQTILVSAFTNAAFSRTIREQCCNNSGRVAVARRYGVGAVSATPLGLRQHFVRLRVDAVGAADDARFDYFTRSWFPTKIQPLMEQHVRCILYVPSYFDFARLKAWLDDQHRGSVAVLCEHSTQKEQRQALGQFSDQERCLLLFTERFYYFRRYFVRNAEAVFFYSPPVVDAFYADVVSRLNVSSPQAQAQTLFCRYDVHELSRVVGAERAQQMLTRPADAFMVVNK